MKTALVEALRDSGGYLQDEGWHQTAGLMTLAADEIQRLTARVHELESAGGIASGNSLEAPPASNQNGVRVAAISSRR
jgi:hypothetical protein